MKLPFNKQKLVEYLWSLYHGAEADEQFSISWFSPTRDESFAIIGGWQGYFDADTVGEDGYMFSKSEPSYVMCVKIAVNEGPYAYTDYEIMNMPILCDLGDEDVYDTELIFHRDMTDKDMEEYADELIQMYTVLLEESGAE